MSREDKGNGLNDPLSSLRLSLSLYLTSMTFSIAMYRLLLEMNTGICFPSSDSTWNRPNLKGGARSLLLLCSHYLYKSIGRVSGSKSSLFSSSLSLRPTPSQVSHVMSFLLVLCALMLSSSPHLLTPNTSHNIELAPSLPTHLELSCYLNLDSLRRG